MFDKEWDKIVILHLITSAIFSVVGCCLIGGDLLAIREGDTLWLGAS